MNMKNILRLMGALALTTGAATSVVACGQKAGVAMNVEVSKQLGLTDDKGAGVLAPAFDASKADAVTWTVTAAAGIKASKLLGDGDKAANQSCFDFIKNVLKVEPKEGTTFADGVFDKTKLDEITSEVTNVTPTLKQTEDKKDYAVTGGTFSFQFKKGDTKLGDVYGIELKNDDKTGVVGAELEKVVGKLAIADTDVVGNKDIKFVTGGPIPATAKKGAVINIVNTTDGGKQFASLNKITGLKITAQMESTDATETWEPGKKLVISYKVGDVNFDAATVKTTLEVPAE